MAGESEQGKGVTEITAQQRTACAGMLSVTTVLTSGVF